MAKALSIEDFADLAEDFDLYSSTCLRIRPKEGELVPFVMNRAQRYLHERAEAQLARTGMVRLLGLKGRQQGFSTYVQGRAYHRTSWRRGFRAFILTHHDEATQNLFGIAKRFHENCPAFVQPTTKAANANELYFGKLDSGYKVATAGGKSAGRSQTIQFLHASECAFWPNAADNARAVFSAVPTAAGTEIFVESTSDGPGNYFHQLCVDAIAGKNEFEFVFIPWWWQDEYTTSAEGFEAGPDEAELMALYGADGLTIEHLAWRRAQISKLGGLEAFKREYPNSIEEAFDAVVNDRLISPALVKAARNREIEPTNVRPIWGVDAARFGDDRSTLCKRQGNVVLEKIKGWQGKDTMQVAGAIVAEYRKTPEDDRPSDIVVDAIGIGAGVADRLREVFKDEGWDKSTKIVDVNFGEGASEREQFNRLRDEMWWATKEWVEAGTAKLCDDEMLAQDLVTPTFWYSSSGKVCVEPKDLFKKRLKRSPDAADALANTFYVRPKPKTERKAYDHGAALGVSGGGGGGFWSS